MSQSIKLLSVIFASGAALAAAAPASADYRGDQDSVVVRYRDLDLGHAAGAKTLLHRIQVAARIACGPEPDVGWWDQIRAVEACRQAAIDKAVAGVGSPILSAMADSQAHPVRIAAK